MKDRLREAGLGVLLLYAMAVVGAVAALVSAGDAQAALDGDGNLIFLGVWVTGVVVSVCCMVLIVYTLRRRRKGEE